jgi:para-aminobenzoate synthetase/4-amino-4-deoxychorismate lyase
MNDTISVWLDFVDPQGGPPLRQHFRQARTVLRADRLEQVATVLDAAHQASLQGNWCVGYVRYEAAPAFDRAYQVRSAPPTAATPNQPLAWFAVFDQALPWPAASLACSDNYAAQGWQPELDAAGFAQGMAQISQAIRDGENYQINYTTRLRAQFEGAALDLFQALQRSQPDCYAACIDTGQEQVLSLSPELFFDWRDGQLLARPMKGTAARGATPEADAAQAEHLRHSTKERAENLMIVDLIRNDLSRVAQPHSVQVPRLFHTQAWPTFWGMTSDVCAQSRPATRLSDLFAALFPCGSVVGVPKVKAMQRICALEDSPRGVYCGAVGVLRPGGAVTFNVAIRTVLLAPLPSAPSTAETTSRAIECGVGSGITSDAQPASEWREWRDKWGFLRRASAPFQILETLALHKGLLPHASAHLARMARAAHHFGYPWNASLLAQAQALLAQEAKRHAQGSWRVRLLLDAHGMLAAHSVAQGELSLPLQVQLARQPLRHSDDEFVRFKTTRRQHYDAFAPSTADIFDTLLWNERGELTEFTRGNVFLKLGQRWLTPALSCGLLDGIARAQVLKDGLPAAAGADAGWSAQEAVIPRSELTRASQLVFVNSCRGWLPAQMLEAAEPFDPAVST